MRSDFDKMVTRHRGALTRAKNSGDPTRVIQACDAAARDFDVHGWPDSWHRWDVAREDALLELARNNPYY